MEPELLICDEVVSALDVSIQGQILNLLLDIREKRDMSFLFIAHDLKVACYFCDRIGVMYRGELMEEAPAANLYKEALHPYTQLLFSSAAGVSNELENKNEKLGMVSSPSSFPIPNSSFSCSFAPRCARAAERCFCEHPALCEVSAGHSIRCFNYADSADFSPINS
jgi:oligopeptide/dipeptide ABC transporter ATP-binding protein